MTNLLFHPILKMYITFPTLQLGRQNPTGQLKMCLSVCPSLSVSGDLLPVPKQNFALGVLFQSWGLEYGEGSVEGGERGEGEWVRLKCEQNTRTQTHTHILFLSLSLSPAENSCEKLRKATKTERGREREVIKEERPTDGEGASTISRRRCPWQ